MFRNWKWLRGEWRSRTDAAGYYAVGGEAAEFEKFRPALVKAGYPSPDKAVTVYGGGGYTRYKRLLFGGGGHGGGGRVYHGDYKTAYGTGTGAFTVGYVAFEGYGLRVYPIIGIGGGGSGLVVAPRNSKRTKPSRLPIAGTGSPVLRLGIGFDLNIPIIGFAGLLIGVQTGLLIPLLPVRWNGAHMGTSKLPRPNLANPYFHILLGGTLGRNNVE
jgi:hypothetical protein